MSDKHREVQSIERAFRILDLLRDNGGAMSVGEIAQALELSRSTVHRLLNTLKTCKAIRQDPCDRRYSLSLHLLLYGKAVLDHFDLREQAHPLLGELSKEVGETVFMGVLDDYQLVYIDHVDSLDHGLRMTPQIGRRQDAHTTALGKTLLAHLEPQRLEEVLKRPLPRRIKHSITSPDDLRKELEKIRKSGYATDKQESEIGICCVAAPIWGADGQVVAAISISGPSERLQQKGLETVLRDRVQATAARISRLASV